MSALFVTFCFGLLFPDKDDIAGNLDDYLWRISYSLQLVPVFITTLTWMLVWPNEPIKFLLAKSQGTSHDSAPFKEVKQAISRNYGEQDEDAVHMLAVDIEQKFKETCVLTSESIGYVKALTHPAYSRASWICIMLALANQLTGINAINIYSTVIFQNL